MKDLKDFTKEDFNKYFPVHLVEHNPEWIQRFNNEKSLIEENVKKEMILNIEHFGSTSISTIKAKPYIDILIEIPKNLLFNAKIIEQFEALNYTYFKVHERDGISAYMSFGKGYTIEPKSQIFHIHMCDRDNFMWQQVKFRDYLIANPEHAKAYEALKLSLAAQHRNDRGAYVLGKTAFIKDTITLINTSENKLSK